MTTLMERAAAAHAFLAALCLLVGRIDCADCQLLRLHSLLAIQGGLDPVALDLGLAS